MNRWFDVERQTKSFDQNSRSEDLVDAVTSLVVLESDVSKWTSWIMICCQQKENLLWNRSYWFLETRVWLDIAIFRDDGYENEGLWVL